MAFPLPRDEIDLWCVFTHQARDDRLEQRYRAILSEDERGRMARFRREKDRHTYLVAHALVRVCLSQYADVAPEDWQFAAEPGGKPVIAGPAGRPPLSFNLSHTAGLAVCGVTASGELGVDAEWRARKVDINVANRFFAPPEREAIRDAEGARQRELFFDVWTLKEAYVKALGRGLALPLRSFCCLPPSTPSGPVRFATENGDPREWRFFRHRPGPEHHVAAALRCRTDRPIAMRPRTVIPFASPGVPGK